MKELETIKAKISELENKKETLSTEIAELSQAINESFEDLIQGKVEEKTLDKVKEKYESLTEELEKTEEYIQRAKAARKKLAVEKFIPFAKERREKRKKEVQAEVEKAVKEVLEARENYVRKLAVVGQAAKKINVVKDEYNDLMRELGEKEVYGESVNLPKVFPEVVQIGAQISEIRETEAVGISKKTQVDAVKYGTLPSWAAGDSE